MLTSAFNHTIWVLEWVRAAIRRPASDDRGASLVEYALLLALIALVCIGAVTLLGSATSDNVTNSADSLAAAN